MPIRNPTQTQNSKINEVLVKLNTHRPQLSRMKYGGVQTRLLTEAIFALGVVGIFYFLCIYLNSKLFCTMNAYDFDKQLLSKKTKFRILQEV